MTEISNPNEAGGTQARAAQEFEIDLLDLLVALAKSKRLIAAITFSAAIIATAVSFLLPRLYTASAIVLPPQQNTSSAALLMGQLGSASPLASFAAGSLGLKNPNDLQVAIIRSRTVEDAMIDRFNLMALYRDKRRSDARNDFEKNSDVENSVKDGLIRISVTAKDPKRAAAMANAYVEEYKKFSATIAVTEAGQRRLFFEQQLGHARESLASAEEALKETEQKTGMIQLDAQAKTMIEAVGNVRAQIAAKEVQLQAMKSFATDQNPDVALQERELAGMRDQLAGLEKQTPKEDDPPVGDPMVVTGKIPAVSIEYANRLRDVKYSETVYDLLAKELEAAKIDEAKQGAIIQVVDKAVEPDKTSSPRRALIIACVTIAAFFASAIWALLAEAIRRLRQDPVHARRLEALAKS